MKLLQYIMAGALAASFGLSARAQTPPPLDSDNPKTDEPPVILSPFEVHSSTDRGYVAGNAVSATRIATVINDLPFTINAITPQFISDTGAENLMDIVSQSAGVKSGVSATTQGNAVFSIRGFVQAPQRNGFSSNQLVSNYVDGSVIERVEVVKGPASLLYGAIAPGGTVNYITKSAEEKAFTDVRFSIGAYNASDVTLDVNQPLIPDKVLFRFVTSYNNGEQYYQNTHSHSTVIYPNLKWIITPNLSFTVDYQGYQQRQDPPPVYLPNTVIATPASIVKSLYGVGYPGSKSALANQTGPAVAEGVSDSSDPGFMRPFPGLPKNFNYADINDVKSDNLKTFNAQLDAKFNDHWTGRIHLGDDIDHSSYNQTGHAAAYIAPPDSMIYANGAWSVAPSWNALTAAQQVAQSLAYAQQATNNLSLLQSTQNGTPSPVIMDRAPRVQTQSVRGLTLQGEAVGSYKLGGTKLQVLAGAFYDHVTYSQATLQNEHTASSPFFRAWDVNTASPSYYVNTNEGKFTAQQMTSIDTSTTTINSDKAAYVLLNASCFDNRLFLVGGARYNVSENQVTDHAAGDTVSPSLRSKYTTPQFGIGYKITRDVLLYASYSESYTLPTQPYLTVAGVVNGIPTAIPTGPASPTIGRGYETGLKGTFFDSKLNITLSVYQIEEDQVLQLLNMNIDGFSIDNWNQGAKQRARGIETSISWELQKNWQILFSAAEEDIRNIKEPFGLEYYLGQNVGYTAKPSVHIWTRYAMTNPALKGLWIGGGADYQGRTAGDPRNRDYYLPSYTILNAAIGYDWKVGRAKMTTTLNFKNLRDVAYKDTPQALGEPRRIQLACTLHY